MDFPELRTQRLLLRAMQPDDVQGYAELLSDPGTHPRISESGPVPEIEIPERIRRNREGFAAGRHIYWSLVHTGQFVGYVALHGPSQPAPALSYAIRPTWRRQGIASEALRVVCGYTSSQLSARELVARTHSDNTASARLLLGLGFREVGLVATPGGPRREFSWSV